MAMTNPDAPPVSRQALEEAAQWFVTLASGEASEADRIGWQAWRAAHPSHELAWRRAEGSTARFHDLPQGQATVSLQALNRAPALASAARRKGLAQLGVLLAAGVAGWQGYRGSDWSADLLTKVGEQRDTTLADGSRLLLDTNSAVEIAFSSSARVIRLRRGRIMIATAADPAPQARPFAVDTADGRVRPLGTRFTVQQEARSTLVTVLEARVAVQVKDGVGDAAFLDAGQALRFDRAGLIARRAAPATEAAWLTGMLVADDMPLGELIAQLARYRQGRLACDPAAAALHISGAFPLRDTERALAAIGRTLPVRLERQVRADRTDGILVVRK